MRSTAFALVLSLLPAVAQAETIASKPAPEAEGTTTVRLLSAGSLKSVFLSMIATYEKTHPVKITPMWGPSGLLLKKMEAGEPFDIFASASLGHAVTLSEKGMASPSVMFVRNAMCVVVPASSAVTTDTVVDTMLKPEVRIGTSTPGSDPGGDYTWEIFHLIDKTHSGAFAALSAKADKLVGNSIHNEKAETSSKYPLNDALEAGKVDMVINYCSTGKTMTMASPGKFKVVAMPKELNVGPQYGLNLSNTASRAAADFAMYILSPAGQKSLEDFGFIPVALPDAR